MASGAAQAAPALVSPSSPQGLTAANSVGGMVILVSLGQGSYNIRTTLVGGKMILPPHGKEFFTCRGKQFFTLPGKEFFTLSGKQIFT